MTFPLANESCCDLTGNFPERFVSKVLAAPSGCWLWRGHLNRKGYGTFWCRAKRMSVGAHRWAWEHVNGPVPEGLQLDHTCRVRHCVNPRHLEPVTCKENLMRGETKVRQYAELWRDGVRGFVWRGRWRPL